VSDGGAFTPEATIGPFYPGAFLADTPQDLWTVAPLVAHRPAGQPIVVAARFLDSLNQPVPSLVVEFWQANAHGRYRHPLDQSERPLDPQFDGFARLRTDDAGVVRLHTIKPGAHPAVVASGFLTAEASAKAVSRTFADSAVIRAPHLRLTIFASGIDRLVTQVFFDDEPLNATDPVLLAIPDPVVRQRLIARLRSHPNDASFGVASAAQYSIDIVLRGDDETPFFDDWD
jgi:protocatechuate 3,4-dioxygenase, alpha subunit